MRRALLKAMAGWMLAFTTGWAIGDNAPFEPPRDEEGHVSFEGLWDSFNLTPLERPSQFGSRTMSPAQAQSVHDRWVSIRRDMSVPGDPTYAEDLVIEPIRGELRTSLIVDPPDGRIPGNALFREWVQEARRAVLHAFDHPEERPAGERCIGSSAGNAPLMTIPANNLHQIVQTPGAVVIASESMRELRVVRMNATHPPLNVTSWTGDSIGWWEGDTLIVETRNFTPGNHSRVSLDSMFFVSGAATVTERFTLHAQDELGYIFTIDDPTNYTRPWTGETRFRRSRERMFEYACHEGNYAVLFMLQGARAAEAARAAAE